MKPLRNFGVFLLGLALAAAPAFADGLLPLTINTTTGQTQRLPVNTPLALQAATVSNESLFCPQGTDPGSPANGAIWCTSAGVFGQFGGITQGPFGSASYTGPINQVVATPASGSSGAAAVRSLVPADLPLATGSSFGAVKPDGTSCTVTGGVLSCSGGGGGGGALAKICTEVAVSAVTSLPFTPTSSPACSITTAYNHYELDIVGLNTGSSSGVLCYVQLSADGGVTFDTASNYTTMYYGTDYQSTAYISAGNGGDSGIIVTAMNGLDYASSAKMEIYNLAAPAFGGRSQILAQGSMVGPIGVGVALLGKFDVAAYYNGALVNVNAIRIACAGGQSFTMTAATLYGYNE